MKHETIKQMLTLYIDGGLNEDEKTIIKNHLKECKECRQELKEYQENYNYLSNLKEEPLPDKFLEMTLEQIENKEKKDARLARNIGSENWFDKIIGLLRTNVRIPAGGIFAATVLVLAVMLIIPLFQQSGNQMPGSDNLEQYNLYSTDTSENRMASFENQKMNQQAQTQGQRTDSDSGVDTVERKVIHRADLQIEVNNLDIVSDRILELVQSTDGFISNSRMWKSSSERRYLYYQLRVPDKLFNQTVKELETYGEVTSRTLGGQDVTEEYIDVETRLKNMEAQEEKYRQLLDKAERVEDVLNIERELERVRSNIESMQQRMKYLNDQVNLSTISIQFSEPEPIVSSDFGLIKALRQAVKKMGESFYQMIVYLGVYLPYFILIVAVYIIYRIRKRLNK